MRPFIILVIALLATSSLFAQKCVERFFEQYSELENVNNISLQGSFLQFASNQQDDQKSSTTINKLKKISAIWTEDVNPISKRVVQDLLTALKRERFEPLIFAREGNSNVNFMIRENGKTITGVVLLVDSDDSFLLINLLGSLKYEDLGEIDLNIEGIEHFKNLPKKRRRA